MLCTSSTRRREAIESDDAQSTNVPHSSRLGVVSCANHYNVDWPHADPSRADLFGANLFKIQLTAT